MTALAEAVGRAVVVLSRPHKHDWRPDLVTCGAEQDALSILRAALHVCTAEECRQVCRLEDGRPTRSIRVNYGDAGVIDGEGPCDCEEHAQ